MAARLGLLGLGGDTDLVGLGLEGGASSVFVAALLSFSLSLSLPFEAVPLSLSFDAPLSLSLEADLLRAGESAGEGEALREGEEPRELLGLSGLCC